MGFSSLLLIVAGDGSKTNGGSCSIPAMVVMCVLMDCYWW
jgi:hypothetical protein